ncbi:MAG: threonine synthase [Candidatus Odinarchaeia archaeon]
MSTHRYYLKCTRCGATFDDTSQHMSCPKCDGILEVKYSLTKVSETLKLKTLRNRIPNVWKYSELLPINNSSNIISLGEGGTFLHKCERLAEKIGVNLIYIKDETTNPTGSFIDRGTTVEISKAVEFGFNSVYCATTGNLAASLVAYAARAGIKSKVILPRNIDVGKFYQIVAYGTDIEFVKNRDEAIHKGFKLINTGHFVLPKNPYFLEGEKTTGYEICEQLNWRLPDKIIVPMGNGGHISMIWKAIKELNELGFLRNINTNLIGTQESCCSPIVEALKTGSSEIIPSAKTSSIASDLSVKDPLCGRLAINSIKESNGTAVSVTDKEIIEAMKDLAKLVGIFAEPASVTTLAGLKKLVESGEIDQSDTVVCVITGMGLKYPEVTKTLARGNKNLTQMFDKFEHRKYPVRLGETKKAILKVLSNKESFGYEIWRILNEEYDIHIKIPSVYQHINELVNNGLLIQTRSESILGHPERIYYEITEKGKTILKNLEYI